MLKQKLTQILPYNLLKEATIYFHCLFDESRFSEICTIMELKNLIDFVDIWKTLEAAKLVFHEFLY